MSGLGAPASAHRRGAEEVPDLVPLREVARRAVREVLRPGVRVRREQQLAALRVAELCSDVQPGLLVAPKLRFERRSVFFQATNLPFFRDDASKKSENGKSWEILKIPFFPSNIRKISHPPLIESNKDL